VISERKKGREGKVYETLQGKVYETLQPVCDDVYTRG
jgi:hypothetical protein